MIRLHVTAEGQTEQNFVKTILAPHLATSGIVADARCVYTSRHRRGGLIRPYEVIRRDMQNWMKEDGNRECRFTTMFDFYRLPHDFPDYDEAMQQKDPYEKVRKLELALLHDIGDSRFIPYLQLHEFEALILADPAKLDWEYLEHERPIDELVKMMEGEEPELINDGPETAPSKRILSRIPEYDKATAGVSIAGHIGLPTLRAKCPHFNDWLTKLENLGSLG